MAASMQAKRQALADFMEAALLVHLPELQVSQRYRRETELQATRKARLAVMGDPVAYLEVLDAGPTERTASDGTGVYLAGRHRFQVSFFLAYEDAEVYEESSQYLFDRCAESTDEAAPGLLHTLRATRWITDAASGCRLRLWEPEEDRKDVVTLDESATELAHLLTFTIGLDEVL